MGRPSDGHENLVFAAMDESLDILNGINDLDREITLLSLRLKDFKSRRIEKIKAMNQVVNASHRNYPIAMFAAYKTVVNEARQIITASYCVDMILESPNKKRFFGYHNRFLESDEIVKCEPKRRAKSNRLKINVCKIRKLKGQICSDGLTGGLFKFANCDENNVKVLPFWNKNDPGIIRIVSPGRKTFKTHKVYESGQLHNPFTEFMMKQ